MPGEIPMSAVAEAARPLTPVFAAELPGIDLRRPLAPEDIVDAINRYAVLVFRHDRELTDAEHLAFARALGPLQRIKMLTMVGKSKTRLSSEYLIDVSNLDEQGRIFAPGDRRRQFQAGNRLWHTDVSFDANRAVYSLLTAHVVPPGGADTEFADMRAAYDALPAATKARLDGLEAEHSIWYSRALAGMTEVSADEKATRPPTRHPLVHIHPRSGRRALYLASHISGIVGWPEQAGRALIAELMEFATRPRFVYRHQWRIGDLVMWDNLATMHRATPFEDLAHPRDLRRATVLEAADT
jgi:alpha-ketoglutarate-dependent 2,4-dichlorophenoxyacetate dioxygenase